MPDAPAIATQQQDLLARRAAIANMVMTGPNGTTGSAPTAGKMVLGQ